MGYDIKEVSKELGVSEKSILKRIKDKNFKEYIYMKNGQIYIKDDGIKYILDNSSKEEMFIENITRIKEIEEVKDRQILYLNKEIEILKLEKEHTAEMLSSTKELLEKRDKEIVRLKERLQSMEVLEGRYNELYSKMSENLRVKEPRKKEKKKFWLKF